jgi:hypothetical protein
MASVNEVYGNNYNKEACEGRIKYSVKILSSNIAQLSLNIRHDSEYIWKGNNMLQEAINGIISSVQEMNTYFHIDHIIKTSPQVNMLPYLIDGPVEYFRIIDLKNNRLYLLYITPSNMEPY